MICNQDISSHAITVQDFLCIWTINNPVLEDTPLYIIYLV